MQIVASIDAAEMDNVSDSLPGLPVDSSTRVQEGALFKKVFGENPALGIKKKRDD